MTSSDGPQYLQKNFSMGSLLTSSLSNLKSVLLMFRVDVLLVFPPVNRASWCSPGIPLVLEIHLALWNVFAPELFTLVSDGYKITLIFVLFYIHKYPIATLVKCFNSSHIMITAELLWDGSKKKQSCMKNLHNLPEDIGQLNQFCFGLKSSSRSEKTCQNSHDLCEYKLFSISVILSHS